MYKRQLLFNLEYIRYASRFYALEQPVYYYVKNPQSITATQLGLRNTMKMLSTKASLFAYYKKPVSYTHLDVYKRQSINCSAEIPEGVDRGWFFFWVTLLNHAYWVTGATLGGLAGSLLSFDTTGLDFVMTAMFVVIFLEQWGKEKGHLPSLIGLGASGVRCV